MPTGQALSKIKMRLDANRLKFWDWALYGDPGSRKTVIIKDILEEGRFDLNRVLYIDAERGDLTLGTLDVQMIQLLELTQELKKSHPWMTFEIVIQELDKLDKTNFPYDLIILEGISLIAKWCDQKVVADKNKNEYSTLEDHRMVLSRMLTKLYTFKWLPCCKIVTARLRNDKDRVSVDGQTVSTGGDSLNTLFIPYISKDFLSLWDIVSRIDVRPTGQGVKVIVVNDKDSKGVQKDRLGVFPASFEYGAGFKEGNAKFILDKLLGREEQEEDNVDKVLSLPR